MDEIDAFLGDGGLPEAVENMEIDQHKGLERNKISGADAYSKNQMIQHNSEVASTSNNEAEQVQPNNTEPKTPAPSFMPPFNINRTLPAFLQEKNSINRNKTAVVASSGTSQGLAFHPNKSSQGMQGVLANNVQMNSEQNGIPGENNQHNMGQVYLNGAHNATDASVIQNQIQPGVNNQQNAPVINNEVGGQRARQDFPIQQNVAQAPHVPPPGPNQFEIHHGNMIRGHQQINQALEQNANMQPTGDLTVRNMTNRFSRRSVPYNGRTAAQTRRQNFDNLASLLWSFSKKFSYVRNPDEDDE